MNVEPLVNAVVAAMMVLEESEPEQVDPDTAVRGLENIGYELLKLSGDDRLEFMQLLERMARAVDDDRTARFMRALPFSVGMVENPSAR